MCADLCQPSHGRSRWVEGDESPDGWGPKSSSTPTSRFNSMFLGRCSPSQARCLWGISPVHSNSGFLWYQLWFLIVIAKQQGVNFAYLYSALSLPIVLVAFLAVVAYAQFPASKEEIAHLGTMWNVSLTPFCCIYPYKYQLLKEKMAWIYKLYYR